MIRTTSLETSKLLKEAGFKQKGEFYYLVDSPIYEKDVIWYKEQLNWKELIGREYYSSPTTDEILEELPKGIKQYWLSIYTMPHSEYWKCGYEYYNGYEISWLNNKIFDDKSLPESLAQMWLYLKKEGLLEKN